MCRFAHAVLRCAALRYASLRVARAALHIPPWGVSQGGYLRGSVLHVCAVSACAQIVQSTLSVSCGAMQCGRRPFSRVGELCASVVPRRGVDTPHPNPKGRRTPTARCLHTHLLHHRPTRPPLHQPFQGGRKTRDPGAPLLSAVCVSPSAWHSPGSGAAKIRKKLRGYPPGCETSCGECLKLHAANLSTWRAPRNSENAAKNGPNTKTARKSTKSRKNKTTRARSNGSSSQQENNLHKRRDQEREPTQDKHEAFHGRRREGRPCGPAKRQLPCGKRTNRKPREQVEEQEDGETAGRQTPRPPVQKGE